eukprot:4242708-Pyramimonas_sp.AAC.1
MPWAMGRGSGLREIYIPPTGGISFTVGGTSSPGWLFPPHPSLSSSRGEFEGGVGCGATYVAQPMWCSLGGATYVVQPMGCNLGGVSPANAISAVQSWCNLCGATCVVQVRP